MSAYAEGYAAGVADRRLGRRLEYPFQGTLDQPGSFSYNYALGYRRGVLGLEF
jgi:hypothetical protein